VNRGQVDPRVRYLTRGRGSTLFLTDDEAVWVLSREEKPDAPAKPKDPLDERARRREPGKRISSVVRMRLEGSKPKPRLEGLDRLPGNVNYFIGNDPKKWRTDVPTYRKVKVEDVYEGIDVVYYGNQRQVEYDFVVRPGVDPSVIRVAFTGADRISTDSSGDLLVATRAGDLRMKSPLVYQERDGRRELVAAAYVVLPGEKKVEFRLAEYDRSRELVIDPVIVWSTFVGGAGANTPLYSETYDAAWGIAVGGDGSPIVGGSTWSDDFPTTPGGFDPDSDGDHWDGFVYKLNPSGTAFVYSTYIGSNQAAFEGVFAVAANASGEAFITGRAVSGFFPVTPGTVNLGGVVFAARLAAGGNQLVYSAFVGGGGDDAGHGIAVDGSGSVFVTGRTQSGALPTTPRALRDHSYCNNDRGTAFVFRLSPDGRDLVYCTLLNGRTEPAGPLGTTLSADICVDAHGNAFVTGWTDAAVDFPITLGAYQPTLLGASDAFVIKLAPNGESAVYSTYLGGGAKDGGTAIAVTSSGEALVAGETYSTVAGVNPPMFPTTPGAYISSGSSPVDGFLVKLTPDGGVLSFSTRLLGGYSEVEIEDLAIDARGAAVVGGTVSGEPPFTPNSPRTGDIDGDPFVARISSDGREVDFCIAFGEDLGGAGTLLDHGRGLALGPDGDIFVAGETNLAHFPTTPGVVQPSYGGGWSDSFVVRIRPSLPVSIASVSPATGPSLGGTPVTITGTGFQPGAQVLIDGTAVTASGVTPTSITIVTGPHAAGPGDLKVVNPDGGAVVAADAFTFVCGGSAPTAFVTGSTGSSSLCLGDSTVISASLSGSGPWNLVWSDGYEQNGIASSPATRTVAPAVSTTYTVRVVTDSLCAGTSSGAAFVTVRTAPSATLTTPVRVCLGTTASASVPATTGATYAWTVTNGSIQSGQGTNAITFTGSTDPVTVAVVATAGTCSASASRAIPVSLPPSATVAGGGTVCAGEAATVSFDLTGAPPFTVRWSDGVVQSFGAAGPGSRSVTPATSTTYTITSLTDANGCAGGVASGSAPVTVNPVPSAAIAAAGSYCAGASGLVASVPDAGAGATYAWTIAGGTIAGSSSGPSVTFTPTGASVTLGVTVTLPSGCTASSTLVSSLAPAPSATVSGGGTICAGSSLTVQAALSGTPPFTLTWSDGFVQSGVATTLATRTVSPTASTTYALAAVQDASCAGSASGSAAVTVVESPRAFVSTPSVLICLGGSATITAQLSGPGPYTLTWSDGVVETVAGPASTRTVTPYLTETYSVVTVSNGTCTVPGTGSTRVIVFPDASAATITAPAEVCAGSGGHGASVPAAGDGTTWVWTATNGTIESGQGTRSVVFSAGASGDTTLAVTVRAAGGCEVSGSLRVRTAARPPLPAIQAPASLESGETGAVAEVAEAEGLTCAWTISNGTITDGADTCRITFSAGDPGHVVLGVVTRNAKGCASSPGQVEVPVRGLSSTLTAPIVLDVAGPGGNRYATELTLANPSPSAVKVTLLYTPATSLGARGGGTVSETLEGGRQRIVPDLLAWLRTKGLEIPSDGSSQGGTLRVTFENVAAGWSPSASTRTTVPSGAGRAGLSMTAVDPAAANAPKVWLFGLRENAADRSHVALANLGEAGVVDLRVTLHSGEGAAVPKHVLPVVRLEAGQWLQLNSVLREAGFTAGYALVERIAGSAPFHAYAVFNDNTTHDGSVVPATPATGLGGTRLVPVVVETGSFTTELVLANPSARAAKARLWFIESLANPGGYSLGGVTVDLAAGEQKILPNVVSAMRQLGLVVTPAKRDYAGTLAVTFSSSGEPAEGWAGARTATAGSGPGRYGLFCPAPAPNAAPGEAWIFGLIQDAANRSNLALLNAAANLGPVTLRYSLFDGATGRKVATSDPVTLGAGAWMQLNGVLSKWKVAQGYVKVERIAGTAPFLAYAVVNDGGVPGAGTGDGSYVEMIPIVR
jgi:hypothetical protein